MDEFSGAQNEHARAEALDVIHVVASEDDSRLFSLVKNSQKFAQLVRCKYIQSNGRLVEKDHARPVEDGSNELHLHSFSEG